jgi:hypothetical protein
MVLFIAMFSWTFLVLKGFRQHYIIGKCVIWRVISRRITGKLEVKMKRIILYVFYSVIVVFGLEMYIGYEYLLLLLGGSIFGLLLFIATQLSKK